MDLQQFSERLAETPFSQAIQITSWAIPAIQTVHILALAVLFAAALMLVLRLWNRGLVAETLTSLAQRFVPVIWWMLVALLITGSLLIVAEPGRTITNQMFYLKMGLLVVAIILMLWLGSAARRSNAAAGSSTSSSAQRLAGGLLMFVLAAIMVAGRFIAYVESY